MHIPVLICNGNSTKPLYVLLGFLFPSCLVDGGSVGVRSYCYPYLALVEVVLLVGGLLAGVMCIFEVSSASLTTFRSIQTLQVGGAWYMQKKAFMYLLLEQGVKLFNLVYCFFLICHT